MWITLSIAAVLIWIVYPISVITYYLKFEAKSDTSGDGGLAFLFLASIPWLPVITIVLGIMDLRQQPHGRRE